MFPARGSNQALYSLQDALTVFVKMTGPEFTLGVGLYRC